MAEDYWRILHNRASIFFSPRKFVVSFWLFVLGYHSLWASQMVQMVKNLLANAEDAGLILEWERFLREGNSNPHQYSCLENPMDRGACQAVVHGVTKESDSTSQVNNPDKSFSSIPVSEYSRLSQKSPSTPKITFGPLFSLSPCSSALYPCSESLHPESFSLLVFYCIFNILLSTFSS